MIMRPRGKKECRIAELSASLPTLRQSDNDWINAKFAENKCRGLYYFCILERCKEYQVIRYYLKTNMRQMEVMQIWLNSKEEYVLSLKRCMRVDGWVTDSEMSFRHIGEYTCYSYLGDMRLLPYSYEKIRSLIPELKRAGLRTSLHGLHPYNLCKALLRDNRLETMFKLRQYYVVFEFYSRFTHHSLDKLWQPIRIALRHGYYWESTDEISDWCDYLDDLDSMGLDIHNPHYICPGNLQEAHSRNNRLKERLRKQAEINAVEYYEPIFKAAREHFFDMVLTDGEIEIKVIPTAKGIKEEGLAMHHCVGGYYNRKESLILSARINGNRIETIEVSLTSYCLVQSRGLQNKYTEYHERICKLVNDNMEVIKALDINHKKELKKAM